MAYAYISGSITHTPYEWLGIYEKIAGVVSAFGMDAYIPHINTPANIGTTITEIKNSYSDTDGMHKDVFHNDTSHVEKASLVIAEVSNPSIGVGIELGFALKANKPIIFLAREGAKVTPLVRGAVQAGMAYMLRYGTENDALEKLKNLLDREFQALKAI